MLADCVSRSYMNLQKTSACTKGFCALFEWRDLIGPNISAEESNFFHRSLCVLEREVTFSKLVDGMNGF